MKATITTLFLILVLVASATDKYVDQMSTNIELVYQAKTMEELQQAINAFERIGNAEKTKWEPFYYAAFGEIMIAVRQKETSKKDSPLDQAEAYIGKALTISPDESEIITLEGFVHTIRLSIDPATRGQKYSMLSMQSFGKALALNPNNPRALSLMAQMQFGTAQFFGSSFDEACNTTNKALEKFETYKIENPLAPNWGKGMTEELKSKCK